MRQVKITILCILCQKAEALFAVTEIFIDAPKIIFYTDNCIQKVQTIDRSRERPAKNDPG